MKVFLTGATGFIGSAIAEQLLAEGNEVVGLARSEESAARLREVGVTVHSGNLDDPNSIAQAVSEADAVIHTAANPNFGQSPETLRSTVDIVVGALSGSDKPLILTSGLGIYGAGMQGVLDEDTPIPTPPPTMLWRLQLEQQVLAAKNEVRAIVLRPAFVYGHAGHAMIRGQIQRAAEAGAAVYIGNGDNTIAFVHVEDLAVAYTQALALAPSGTVLNIAGSHISGKELAEGISYAAGCEGRTVSIAPEEAGTLGAGLFLVGSNVRVSGVRATQMLHWTPRSPSVLYELIYGSYRQLDSGD